MCDSKRSLWQVCLFFIFLTAFFSCKKDDPVVKPSTNPTLESYLMVGDLYYPLTNALVATEKKGDTTIFKVGFINPHDEKFLVIESLVERNTSVLKDGEYEFKKSKNPQDLTENKFNNVFLYYGKYLEEIRLDGKAGKVISEGNLKVETKGTKTIFNLTLTIDSKKVKVYYEGPLKYEEFNW